MIAGDTCEHCLRPYADHDSAEQIWDHAKAFTVASAKARRSVEERLRARRPQPISKGDTVNLPAEIFSKGSDEELLELADAYEASADKLRSLVEARRGARESLENVVILSQGVAA